MTTPVSGEHRRLPTMIRFVCCGVQPSARRSGKIRAPALNRLDDEVTDRKQRDNQRGSRQATPAIDRADVAARSRHERPAPRAGHRCSARLSRWSAAVRSSARLLATPRMRRGRRGAGRVELGCRRSGARERATLRRRRCCRRCRGRCVDTDHVHSSSPRRRRFHRSPRRRSVLAPSAASSGAVRRPAADDHEPSVAFDELLGEAVDRIRAVDVWLVARPHECHRCSRRDRPRAGPRRWTHGSKPDRSACHGRVHPSPSPGGRIRRSSGSAIRRTPHAEDSGRGQHGAGHCRPQGIAGDLRPTYDTMRAAVVAVRLPTGR